MLILPMPNGEKIGVEPHHISHAEREMSSMRTLLWLEHDNMPTVIDLDFTEVVTQINEATADRTAWELENMHNDWARHAADLIMEIRRLQWAFGGACLIAFILLVVIMVRS